MYYTITCVPCYIMKFLSGLFISDLHASSKYVKVSARLLKVSRVFNETFWRYQTGFVKIFPRGKNFSQFAEEWKVLHVDKDKRNSQKSDTVLALIYSFFYNRLMNTCICNVKLVSTGCIRLELIREESSVCNPRLVLLRSQFTALYHTPTHQQQTHTYI